LAGSTGNSPTPFELTTRGLMSHSPRDRGSRERATIESVEAFSDVPVSGRRSEIVLKHVYLAGFTLQRRGAYRGEPATGGERCGIPPLSDGVLRARMPGMPTTTEKCKHPACNCQAQDDSDYCSQYCHDAGGTVELSCNCGHAGCAAEMAHQG
jgi:hypothetical protein